MCEFVVGSRPCSERFFSGYSGFPLSLKTNISKFQLTLKSPERDEPIKYVFIDDTCMDVIERFMTLLYDRTSSRSKVNEVWQELFSRKARSLDNIPPTQASLLQHVKRAVFQGGFVWGQTLLKQPALPSPSRWGWQLETNHWVPHWTTLSQAKESCYELIRCGCKAGCRGRCKCQKANLTCTGLCNCGGNCN